jgi:cell wall-associated NlpC family hydrolase
VKNNFYNKNPYINLYEKPSYKSKISSQIIYGEKFKILSKKKGWLKIKTAFDKYIGYTKNIKYSNKFSPTHKISVQKTNIFSFPKNSNKYKQTKKLPFASRIEILKKYKNFIMFEKNKWIYLKDIKKNNFKEKNFIKILNLFINCKYKWGGKTFNGIDCSALVQMYYLYNNKYFPRDTKDQIKIKKGRKNSNNLKKGNIIYWKGHVAVCINSKKLIHAYGPKKKVLIMNIKNTIKIIQKTANLKVKKITKI